MNEKIFLPDLPIKTPENEAERQEQPGLNLIFSSLHGKDLIKEVLEVIVQGKGQNVASLDAPESIIEELKKQRHEAIFLFLRSGSEEIDAYSAMITKIRNCPEITNQPVIFAFSFSQLDLKQLESIGADLGLVYPFELKDLFKNMETVPQWLGSIEDDYGDTILKNKQAFYKQYGEQLKERSEITADTEKELKILDEIFKENKVQVVLDAGGGSGRIALPLSQKGYEITNLDSSKELLDSARKQDDGLKTVNSDLKNLPIKDGQYDAITLNWHVLCDILGVKGKKQLLAESHRVLKEAGVIVLDIPDRDYSEVRTDGVYITYPDNAGYKRAPFFVGYVPTSEEVCAYLEAAQFKGIEVRKWLTKNNFPKLTFIGKK